MKLSHFFPASLASLFPMRKSNLTPSLLQPQWGQGGLWWGAILPMVAVCHTAVQCWPDPHSVLSLGQLTPRGPRGRAGDTLQQHYTTERGRQQSCHPVASGQG